MLYSVVLTDDKNPIKNEWTVTNDEYGHTFFSNENIHQRICLGKKVTPTITDHTPNSEDMKIYEIPAKTFISNNNKNMNLTLMNFWSKNKEDIENHLDDEIAYITISNAAYKLLKYDTCGNTIAQTYKMKSSYQGCAVRLTDKTKTDKEIIKLYVKDLANNKYTLIEISIENDMIVKRTRVLGSEDKKTIGYLRNLEKILGERSCHFKMSALPGQLLTNTYIILPEFEDRVCELVKNIPNSHVICVSQGMFEEDASDEEKAELKETLGSVFTEGRIRAVTTIGVKLPRTFCKEYKMLYLFNYDLEKGILRCNKSN